MSPSYLLVLAKGGQDCGPLAERISERTGLKRAYYRRGIAALAGPSCPCIALGESGCVIGTLFERRGRRQAVLSLRREEAAAIAAAAGSGAALRARRLIIRRGGWPGAELFGPAR